MVPRVEYEAADGNGVRRHPLAVFEVCEIAEVRAVTAAKRRQRRRHAFPVRIEQEGCRVLGNVEHAGVLLGDRVVQGLEQIQDRVHPILPVGANQDEQGVGGGVLDDGFEAWHRRMRRVPEREVFEGVPFVSPGNQPLGGRSTGTERRRQCTDRLADPRAVGVSAQAPSRERDVMAAFAEHQHRLHRTPRRSKSIASCSLRSFAPS